MTDYDSSGGGGVWDDITKWTPTPPAGGPTQNDRVIIKVGHPITVPVGSGVSIGMGSGWAISIENGGILINDEDSIMNLYGEVHFDTEGVHQIKPGAKLDLKVDGLSYHKCTALAGAASWITGVQMIGTQAKPIILDGGQVSRLIYTDPGVSYKGPTHVMEWVQFDFDSIDSIYGNIYLSTRGTCYFRGLNILNPDLVLTGSFFSSIENTSKAAYLEWDNWSGKITCTGAYNFSPGGYALANGNIGIIGYMKNMHLIMSDVSNAPCNLGCLRVTSASSVSGFEFENCTFENQSTGPAVSNQYGNANSYGRDEHYVKFINCQYLTQGAHKWRFGVDAGGPWIIDKGSDLLQGDIDVSGATWHTCRLIIAKQNALTMVDSGGSPLSNVSLYGRTGKQDPISLRPYDSWAEVTESDGEPDTDVYLELISMADGVWTYYSDGTDKPEITFTKDNMNQWSYDNQNWNDIGTPIYVDPYDENYTDLIYLRSVSEPGLVQPKYVFPVKLTARRI